MPREAKFLSSYTLNGLTFSTFTWHRGNSFILVHCPSLPSIPARIESILQTPANDTFLVTQYFLRPTSCDDPFKKYPVLQSSLWSQDLGQLAIVKLQDVAVVSKIFNETRKDSNYKSSAYISEPKLSSSVGFLATQTQPFE